MELSHSLRTTEKRIVTKSGANMVRVDFVPINQFSLKAAMIVSCPDLSRGFLRLLFNQISPNWLNNFESLTQS